MHLRVAALLLLSIVILSFATFLVFTGSPIFIAMAVDMTLYRTRTPRSSSNCITASFAGVVHTQRDLQASQEKTQRLNDENFRLASIDSLTDLPNRRSFFASLRALSEQALATGGGFNVGLIDLDGFKQVNDIYGHASGDLVLQEVGVRLLALAEPGIFFARLRGDEFEYSRKTGNRTMRCSNWASAFATRSGQPYRVVGNIAGIVGHDRLGRISRRGQTPLLKCSSVRMRRFTSARKAAAVQR